MIALPVDDSDWLKATGQLRAALPVSDNEENENGFHERKQILQNKHSKL